MARQAEFEARNAYTAGTTLRDALQEEKDDMDVVLEGLANAKAAAEGAVSAVTD